MGLFSNKKKVEVNVDLKRAIDDNLIPDTTITSTTKAILENGVVAEFLADGWMNSIGTRSNRMYQYAKKWHPYGMPVSTLHSSLDGQAIVKKVMEAELGKTVTLGYYKAAPFNVVHHAWETLVKQYDYDSNTNQIAVLSQHHDAVVYLKDIVPIYSLEGLEESPAGGQEVWGVPANSMPFPGRLETPISLAAATPFEVDADAEKSIVRVIYLFQVVITQKVGNMEVDIPEWREGTLDIDLSNFSLDAEYYQVWFKDPGNNKWGFWSHPVNSETYPELAAIHEAVFTDLGTYYPFTYFRYNFQAETTARQEYSDPYEDQKKMLKYLNMDYDQIGDAINGSSSEDTVHGMLIFGVNPGSDDPTDQKYLYEYFNALWYATGGKNPVYDPKAPALSDKRFSIADKRFTMSFGFKSITKTSAGGEIAKVGQCTGSYSNKVYTYRYQRTAAMYDEITVHGLLCNYKVFNGYSYTGGAGSKTLIIPLDKALVNKFSVKDREVLVARAMHYMTCTYVEIEEKWYSKSWVKWVIVVVAIVLTVFTGQGWQLLSAVIAGELALTALLIYMVTKLVMGMVVSYIFSLIAKTIGAELAMLIGAVVMLYGGYKYMTNTVGPMSIRAETLLGVGTNLMDAGSAQIGAEIRQIQGEMTEFSLMAEQKWAELEEVKNLLGKENLLDPFEFIGREPAIVFGENPDQFYERTIHTGNIGVLALDANSSFIEISLTLPKLPQTFGESDYELV